MPDLGASTLLVAAALVLGLQHGIDWDHIAAIADLTGSAPNPRRGFTLATLYVLGHAAVVLGLGLLAIGAGLTLPDWTDDFMQPLVGLTLIALGIWVLVSLRQDPEEFRLRSRWMALGEAGRAVWMRLARQGERPIRAATKQAYGVHAAVAIGAVHGIGAETPSQVLLFLTAAGAAGPATGTLVLLAFIAGLALSNTGITLISLSGLRAAQARQEVYRALALVVAVFSLAAGILFLTGQTALLPAIAPLELLQ